ncbi:MAG: hypothetical protein FVQ78_08875, partial [Solirubrobacterales bacterium]|nr:hypothetical protein [Solirubrobacterales bacterium]
MLRRRPINPDASAPRLRSTLAAATGRLREAGWAVEDRVVWGGRDAVRGIVDLVRWPFERLAWAVERRLIWPLQERTGGWSGPARAAGGGALAAVAIGAVALGAVL